MSIKRFAKQAVLHAAEKAGSFRSTADSHWRRERLLILCYHGIAIDDEQQWNPQLFIARDTFARRMQMLAESGATVLRLTDALQLLSQKALPPRSVVLTFDDGNCDFLVQAAPILRQHEFRATVYLTTYYSEKQLPVPEMTWYYLLWKGRERSVDLRRWHGADHPPLHTPEARRAAVRALAEFAQRENLDAEGKHAIAAELAAQMGIDFQSILDKRILHIMTPAEARSLAGDFDFELHTHRHRTPSDPALYKRELDDNRTRIAQYTGRTPIHFCYPSGVYDPKGGPFMASQGVVSATTGIPGLVEKTTDPYFLPRFVDTEVQSEVIFRSWISGFAARLLRKYS